MINEFITIQTRCEGKVEEKKSRFLAFAAPIITPEDALAFVSDIKKEHYNARHIAFAFVSEKGIERSSDAGEPTGSAGSPILDVLKGAGNLLCPMRGVVIAVARYFGGTLLGVGGLVRAYGAAARGAICSSKLIKKERRTLLSFSCTYNEYGIINSDALAKVIKITVKFTESVNIKAYVNPEKEEEYKTFLSNLSNGKIKAEKIAEEWIISTVKTEI